MEFKDYVGKKIIAWYCYNVNYELYNINADSNTKGWLYPRYIYSNNEYIPVNSQDFPQRGSLEMRIKGGATAEDVYEKCGSLVNITINKDDAKPDVTEKNFYSLMYNPTFSRNNSEIWIEKFSGYNLCQVIDIDCDIERLRNTVIVENKSIYTNLILLRYNGIIYGPFEHDEINQEQTQDSSGKTIQLFGVKDYQYTVAEYKAFELNDDLLIIKDQYNNEVIYLLPIASLSDPNKCEKKYDWISDETLVDTFTKALKENSSYSRSQLRQIKDSFVEIYNKIPLTHERRNRIKDLIDNLDSESDLKNAVVEYALGNPSTKEIIIKEIIENYFEKVKNDIENYSTVEQKVSELKDIAKGLESEISEDKVAMANTNNLNVDKLNEQIQELKVENQKLQEKNNLKKNIDDLKKECEYYTEERNRKKDRYEQQIIDNKDLQDQLNKILADFNDKAKQTQKVLDNKMLAKVLRGLDEGETCSNKYLPFDENVLHPSMDYNEIIDRVRDFIRDKALRDISRNEVANYLICITQGFITTFAGEPGTGKTSLCNILAKAMGLVTEDSNNRFVDVSVERGWTSHKDFIGYYNPLTKTMEKSNKEVFASFELLDQEYNKTNIAPFIILLDEANLSPIEHYWAAFLKNCDLASNSLRTISLGGNNSWKIPSHLRFLATVNFDHTTEELSPRFLDRSWIITLNPVRIDEDSDENPKNYEDMIPFESVKIAFTPQESDEIDKIIQQKWEKIQEIFMSVDLPIMPRNLKMVKHYCTVACRCMNTDTPSTKYAPLDYALSQKILPTINGNGKNYEELIKKLIEECPEENMPLTAKNLSRMQNAAGINMGFYQFFAK